MDEFGKIDDDVGQSAIEDTGENGRDDIGRDGERGGGGVDRADGIGKDALVLEFE